MATAGSSHRHPAGQQRSNQPPASSSRSASAPDSRASKPAGSATKTTNPSEDKARSENQLRPIQAAAYKWLPISPATPEISGDLHLTHQWRGPACCSTGNPRVAIARATSKVHYRARRPPNHSHRLCTAIAAGQTKTRSPSAVRPLRRSGECTGCGCDQASIGEEHRPPSCIERV